MKKEYTNPQSEIIEIKMRAVILEGSDDMPPEEITD